MTREIDKIWAEAIKGRFPDKLACACPGACNELGYCPLNGMLRVYTQAEVNQIISAALSEQEMKKREQEERRKNFFSRARALDGD